MASATEWSGTELTPGPQYSCVRCKERKIRCDKTRPCRACVRYGIDCVERSRAPYTSTRRRKRTPVAGGLGSEPAPSRSPPPAEQQSTAGSIRSERQLAAEREGPQVPNFGQSLWTGLQEFRDPRSKSSALVETDQTPVSASNTPLSDPASFILGGALSPSVDLQDAHPSPVNVFTLWQAFLQNVYPLTKIIYAPSVQEQVVEAARDFSSIPRSTAALLFSVYAAAVSSMTDDECQTKLREPRKILLDRYLVATQQALATAGFIGTPSLVLLQAFATYLVAARRMYEPSMVWILTGMAVRMAQRLHLDSDEISSNISFFEVQMRRRVWWHVLLVDGRTTVQAGKSIVFSDSPTSALPANLNDADLSPGMTGTPKTHEGPTEMIFCLLRYEVGKFFGGSGKRLNHPSASTEERDRLIDELEEKLDQGYLRYCDPAIPLHRVAAGGARSAICKMRVMAHHPSQYADKGKSMPQSEHDLLFSASLEMIDLHVQGYSDTAMGRFMWHVDNSFQLDALVFMLIESRTQPPSAPLTERAWAAVDGILKYRADLLEDSSELLRAFQQLVLRAWETRESEAQRQGLAAPSPPLCILKLRSAFPQQQSQPAPAARDNPPASPGIAAAVPSGPVLYPNTQDTSFSYQMDLGSSPAWEGLDWDSWDFWDELLKAQPVS